VKADHKTVAAVRKKKQANGETPHKAERTETSGRKARGRKVNAEPDDERFQRALEKGKALGIIDDGMVSEFGKPKAAQEVFDSPQEAHAKAEADALELGELAIAWSEVEAAYDAGNKEVLICALNHLKKECGAALARLRSIKGKAGPLDGRPAGI
jgi:hypothetical protein